jgi:hypothetical protein
MMINRSVIEYLCMHVDQYINDGYNALDIAMDKPAQFISDGNDSKHGVEITSCLLV